MSYVKKYLHKKFLFPLFTGFFVFLFVKFFLFDVVVIKSPSMEPTVKQGEWFFIKRFFTPERNDIVQVSLPFSEKDTAQEKIKSFKRITGMPGDSLSVVDSRIYINGKQVPENKFFLHNYIAKIKTQSDSSLFAEAGITQKYLIDDSCVYLLCLTEKRFTELLTGKKFYSLVSNAEDSALYDENIFPFNPQIKWNKDFFGPLYIPKKGDVLKLDTSNIKLYGRLITDFEGNSLKIEKNQILINETEINTYKVKQNYYFVTGDNFDSSIDSRQWGFVPENKLKARLLFKH
ncbi:MAG TPA: signal peptidase I [Bacteroidia bacterium]|jgi:signal peptidase I|nr:signal peptidase I [Bacteroidia bacterium]